MNLVIFVATVTLVLYFISKGSSNLNTSLLIHKDKIENSADRQIQKNKNSPIVKANNEKINGTSQIIRRKDSDGEDKRDLGETNTSIRRPVKLNMKQGLTMNQILSVYALTEVPNELCRNHSMEFAKGLRAFEPWALKMFDASSKLQSGVLAGNLVEFGSFYQCIKLYENSTFGPIRGKHCTLRIYPDIQLIKKILSYKNITEKRFGKVYIFVKGASLDWSICVPDSCDSLSILQHYEKIISSLTEGLNVSIALTESDCVTTFDDKPLNRTELGIIAAFATYLLVIAVFTIVDLYSTPEEAKENKLLNIFSAYTNSKQIFARVQNATDLDCVHGIRFLSTCYVVIGHRYLMMMFFPVINSLEIMDWVLYYRSTVITGGTLCVDTFFMVSGMLVSIGYFEQIAKNHRINWPMFYIYRYMRITPPLAVVVLWYSTLIQHFGSGPLWRDMLTIIQKPCQEYWWATILHVQNYVHPFPLCLTQAWYLTCDMQYYYLSPIILIPLSKFPVFGYVNYCLIYILSMASNFYYAWINRYDGGVPVTNQLFSTKYFQHHYIAPHTRAATYIIGLGFGHIVFKAKGHKPQLAYPTIVVGWIFCVVTMSASLVGCHTFHTEEHDYNRLEASIFLSCSRSGWTFGIVWIVWACINGYGGPINSILSSHTFRVLGRISYGVYLLHMLMQYLTSGASKMPGYFSDFSALYAAFSDLFIMIVIGFAFTVCFESPLVKSLSMLVKRGSRKKVSPDN